MPTRLSLAIITALAGICFAVTPARAGLLVGGPGVPGQEDCKPFGCSDAAVYQQIFGASLFGGPRNIAGLTFFLRNFDNHDPLTGAPIIANEILPATYTIVLSTVSIPVNGLDPAVDSNIDPLTAQTFFIGSLSGPVNDHFTITTAPANFYNYDPSLGNLLLDIRTDSTDLSLTLFLDATDSSGGEFSSAWDSVPHPSACPDGTPAVTVGCADADRGLVIEFLDASEVQAGGVPEPGAFGLVAGGLLAGALAFRRRLPRP